MTSTLSPNDRLRRALFEASHAICNELMKIAEYVGGAEAASLRDLKWQIGEANTDVDFSKLTHELGTKVMKDILCKWDLYEKHDYKIAGPDFTITLTSRPGMAVEKLVGKIELKTTKSKDGNCPGSTSGTLDINQPTIMCLRPANRNDPSKFQFRCCQYRDCMKLSDTDLAVDRTPRVPLNFYQMPEPGEVSEYEDKGDFEYLEHYTETTLNRHERGMSSSWFDTLQRNIVKASREKYLIETSIEDIIKDKAEAEARLKATQ